MDDLLVKTANLIHELGYCTITTRSQSTESAYIDIGTINKEGGFSTVLGLRFSKHSKYGWRAGYIKMLNSYHIRVDRPKKMIEGHIEKAIARLTTTDCKSSAHYFPTPNPFLFAY